MILFISTFVLYLLIPICIHVLLPFHYYHFIQSNQLVLDGTYRYNIEPQVQHSSSPKHKQRAAALIKEENSNKLSKIERKVLKLLC
jgi:hypothetical protein